MKKIFLAFTLIVCVVFTATACPNQVGSPGSVQQSSENTEATTTEPAVTTPPITDNRTIEYELEFDALIHNEVKTYNGYMRGMELHNEHNSAAAICLITLTDIGTSILGGDSSEGFITYPTTPVQLTIDKIYVASNSCDLAESESVYALDHARWFDNGNENYTVKYYDVNIPLSAIGSRYIAYIHEAAGDPEVHGYDWQIRAMTIPLSENIDDEEYINQWAETLQVEEGVIAVSKEVVEKIYKAQ